MSEPVTLHIAEREYTVACEPHERPGLLEASRLLDTRMREARAGNRSATADRIAVLVALNLAHELLQGQRHTDDHQYELQRSIEGLSRKLDRLLDSARAR